LAGADNTFTCIIILLISDIIGIAMDVQPVSNEVAGASADAPKAIVWLEINF